MEAQRPDRAVRPRKRPKQERSKQTVDAIISAAAQVFAERGYAATTTNHIAARAGVSIGSLYQYFPSKEAILLALAEAHMERAFAAVLEAVERTRRSPLPVLIRELVDSLVRAHQLEPGLHRVIFEETHPDPALRQRLDELEARSFQLARDLLEERCAEIVVENPIMASLLVVQVLEGVTHIMAIQRPEILALPEFRNELTRMLESYLMGKTASTPQARAAWNVG